MAIVNNFWFNKFQRGRMSVFDERQTGNVTKVEDLVLADRENRQKVREITEIAGI